MPATALLVVVGPELFALVFGENWRQAGEYARYMAPWLYMVFITSPLSTLFLVFERENIGMAFQAGLLVARLVAIFIGATLLEDLNSTVALFSSVSTIFWIGFLLWVFSSSGNKVADIYKPTIKALIKAFICISPLVLAFFMAQGSLFWFYVAVTATASMMAKYYWTIFRKVFSS